MSGFDVKVSGNIGTILGPISSLAAGGGRQALQEGLSDGGDKVRTKVRKAMRAQTNPLKYETITSRVDGKRFGLAYIIKGDGKKTPIALFPHSVAGAVTAAPWGVSRTFKRSFVRPDTGALSARTTSKRFPVRKLYGPNMAKEVVKGQSLAAFEVGVSTDVLPAIERRLARLLAKG
ncbi:MULTISPECIES: hypothetical protein [unclassified Bradyrhizobium]|uniref:hypothetical protein n=1 Tax=unclassified Bradyrhizobium TaxID=2631580 RepID=UPI002916D253|nr:MULTISPECIES: hypothetical protein [unclassified Bradyrhizobium]